jgi:hypothetical protein
MATSFNADFEESLEMYSTAADEAEAAVVAMGLNHAERPINGKGDPDNLPELPDLSECTPTELAHYISLFTAWHNYANGRLVYFQKIRDIEAEKRGFTWSYLRKRMGGTVSDKDDAVKTDSRWVSINRQYIYADNMVRDLDCIVNNLERNVKTISRVIAVMEQRLETEGFGASVGRKQQQKRSDVMRHFAKGRR